MSKPKEIIMEDGFFYNFSNYGVGILKEDYPDYIRIKAYQKNNKPKVIWEQQKKK